MANPCAGRAWQTATAPFRQACEQANAPCWLCHNPIDYRLRGNHRWAFTVDHAIARMHGGPPLNPATWRPAHRSCNSSRGAKENAQRRTLTQPKPIYHHPRTELTW